MAIFNSYVKLPEGRNSMSRCFVLIISLSEKIMECVCVISVPDVLICRDVQTRQFAGGLPPYACSLELSNYPDMSCACRHGEWLITAAIEALVGLPKTM